MTEKRGNTCRPSGERMIPDWTIFLVSRLVISLPSNQILPLLTGMRPIMAGAVCADEGDDLARVDIDVDFLERMNAAIIDNDLFQSQ